MSLSAGLAHVERERSLLQPHRHARRLELPRRHHRLPAGRRDGARRRQHRARRRGPDRAALGRAPTRAAWAASSFCNMLDRERADFDHALGAPARGLRRRRSSPCSCRSARSTSSAASSTCSRMKAYTYDGRQGDGGRRPGRPRRRRRGGARQAHRRGRRAPTTSSPRSTSWKRRSRRSRAQRGVRRRRRRRPALPGRLRLRHAPHRRRSHASTCSRSPRRPPTSRAADGHERGDAEVELVCDPAQAGRRLRLQDPRRPVQRPHQRVPRLPGHGRAATRRSSSPATATRSASASCSRPWARRASPPTASCAGDIGAVAKLKDVVTGDTLCADGATPSASRPSTSRRRS